MSLLDDPLRSVARTLIGVLGTAACVFTRTVRTYTPSTDTKSESTTTASLKMTPPQPIAEHRINGTSILATDLTTLVAALDVVAASFSLDMDSQTSIKVVFDGSTYAVAAVNTVYSGNRSVYYELILRK